MGFTEKSDFQGVHKKAKYRGELPKKGASQFADLWEGAWQKRVGWCF